MGLCGTAAVEEGVMVLADLLNGRLRVDCGVGRMEEARVEDSFTELSVEEDFVVGIELFESLEPLGVVLSDSFDDFFRRKSLKKGILVLVFAGRRSPLTGADCERIHIKLPAAVVPLPLTPSLT